MHGLIGRAIQNFVHDTYGPETWLQIVGVAAVPMTEFEPLKIYSDDVADKVLDAVALCLERPREEILEDMGLYLVAHPNCATVRRLLRFGGDTFLHFLHSLNELPDRVRLAVSDLDLPELDLREHYAGNLTLTVFDGPQGFGHVLVGLLRAMADDFGALVMLEHMGRNQSAETLQVQLLEVDYAQGRAFQFAGDGTAP